MILAAFGQPGGALAQAGASVSGTVTDVNNGPLQSSTITLSGAQTFVATTDAAGAFSFDNVPPGTYTLTAARNGYDSQTQRGFVVSSEGRNVVTIALAQRTLSTIQEIGRVSTRQSGVRINTTPASSAIISSQTFIDQGATQVMQILDETPGIISQYPGGTANPAASASVATPSIRGALGYETSTLIDGHPLATQSFGDYVVTYLNPFMFQSVELIKGPGAAATQDNYAINGTVNFRTLEPTAKPAGSIMFGVDDYGGQFSNYRATGTIFKGKLGFALDYAIDGTPGPLRGATALYSSGFSPSTTYPISINGVPLTSYGTVAPSNVPANIANYPYNVANLVGCCYPLTTAYQNKGELAKLRINFSPSTVFTGTFLGTQSWGNQASTGLYNLPVTFSPGAGYTGPIPAGTSLTTVYNPYEPPDTDETDNEPIFQGEFRTSPTPHDNIIGRYYTAVIDRLLYNSLGSPTATYSTNMTLYGTFTPTGSSSPIVLNGQNATVTFGGEYFQQVEDDILHGGSFEFDHAFGDGGDVVSLALDSFSTVSQYYELDPTLPASGFSIYPGSHSVLTTGLLRGNLVFGPHFSATITNYLNNDYFYYTPNQGMSFVGQHSQNYVPRLGAVYHPSQDLAVRFAVGGAIAPPFLSLLETSTASSATCRTTGAIYCTQTVAPSSPVQPETSFGYDLGSDVRLGKDNLISGDLYLNNVFNQFAQPYTLAGYCVPGTSTSCTGTVPSTTAGAVPLYSQSVSNLANSRFAGVELTVKHDPLVGIGGYVQGSMMRAFAYNLSPCYYSANCGTPLTNLSLVNGVNFPAGVYTGSGSSGPLGTGLQGVGAVPYAQGYGELHYRSERNGLASLGVTYYGNNNTFQEPPFFLFNATLRWPIFDAKTFVQFSAYNLFSVLNNGLGTAFSGTPSVVLANGQTALTNAKDLGPTTVRLSISRYFGDK